jgi:glycosyltransferase involved in cell wall biosynthesis
MIGEHMVTADDGRQAFRPVRTADWDVLEPFPAIDVNEPPYCGSGPVHLLVRLATEPLGYADFEFDHVGSLPEVAAASVSQSFLPQINARLEQSGLPLINEIPAEGLHLEPGRFAFVAERERVLEDAPQISVVLCTKDRPARAADCIRNLVRQEYPNYEIVVVDNAPTDPGAVPAALEALDSPIPLRYVVEPVAGHSRGKNTGWRAAKADIVAFIDDDEVPDKHWLAEIARGFSATSNVGCVSGMVLPAELRTEPQFWFEELAGLATVRGFDQEVYEPGHPQSPLWPNPPFGIGGNVAFRRNVLVDIGGYDIAMGLGTPTNGSDDNVVFARTLLGKHTLVYQPTALIFHFHRDSMADLEKQLHGYAMGTVASYAALISRDPKLFLSLLRLIPTAIRDPYRKATVERSKMLPASLRRLERKGRRQGIPAYIRSVKKQRATPESDPALVSSS